MTRHGTLAYYLAAWVIGCPVVALMVWLIVSIQTGFAGSAILLEFCFFSLMCGAIDMLFFAFILRRAMHGLGTRNAAVWALTGGALSLLMLSQLAWVFGKLPGNAPAYLLRSFVFAGPQAIWTSGWWQAPIDGACVAAVLCLVDRAFNRVDASETGASAEQSEAAPVGQSPA
jgi:hypothetical protein